MLAAAGAVITGSRHPSCPCEEFPWPRVPTGRVISSCRWSRARSRSIRPSSSTERVSFNRINKKTGNRLKQQLVDAETGEPVEKEDVGRGYEIGKGQYLQVEDEELEKIQIESTHTIEIDSFVPRAEIDDRYLDSPYYIAPTDKVGQEAFAVIRDTIRDKGMVALGRVVLARREHVVMLEAFDKGLLATTLRYPYEVREASRLFRGRPRAEAADRNEGACRPHRRQQGRRISIPRPSRTTTRPRWSRCCAPSRPAG